MTAVNDLQESIFLECKDIIHKVSQITNREEILEKSHLVSELLEKISNLKFIQSNQEFFNNILISNEEINDNDIQLEENIENTIEDISETEIQENVLPELENEEENEVKEEIIEEKIQEEISPELENEEEEIINEEENAEIPEITLEIADEEEIEQETYTENIVEEENPTEITIDIAEEEEPKNEEEIVPVEVPHIEEITSEEEQEGKKMKLVKIKNMNHIQALFDEETLEQITEKPEPKQETKAKNTAPKREFVLDLNDKIAFSKMLFGGSQTELNDVVKILNSFENIDEAKQYLSDMYYDKNWDKVDEYAQRLWFLVENRFI